jgi:peptidoglycan/xylan/chitin deacetylase (PgdA/CDA1 family)
MRLVAAAGTLVVVAFLAIFGAILLHERSIADSAFRPSASAATAPAVRPVTSPTVPVTLSSAVRPILPEPQAVVPERPVPVQSFAQAPARPAPPPAVAAPAPAAVSCPGNPNALGVARVVEVDTLGGPGFGFEHFKSHDFLQPGEVVLTFDDGPWPRHTPAVLAALAAHCTKAIFFPIGKHATYYPEILRQVAAAGHTIGSHTWSHQNLMRAKSPDEAKAEIEKAISAVKWALEDQGQEAPFFRFPALQHPPEMVTYLGTRNIAIFSTDMDSFDFKMRKPEQVVKSVMAKLQKHGKGIVLMHDFQKATAEAVPQLLAELKAGGYKIVHMKPRTAVSSLPQYDEELMKETKLPTVSQRPVSSVVRDIE